MEYRLEGGREEGESKYCRRLERNTPRESTEVPGAVASSVAGKVASGLSTSDTQFERKVPGCREF